jgi:hypothetical protein
MKKTYFNRIVRKINRKLNDNSVIMLYKKINKMNNYKSINKNKKKIDKNIVELIIHYFAAKQLTRNIDISNGRTITEFNGDINKACFIALSSYIISCFHLADEITQMKIKRTIIYFYNFAKYLGDVIDIWYDFFDIIDGPSFITNLEIVMEQWGNFFGEQLFSQKYPSKMEGYIDQYIQDLDDDVFNMRSLGYLLWKGNVDSIDEIVSNFSPHEIVNKCFFIKDNNNIFLEKLSNRVGEYIDYVKILLSCKKYELLRSFMNTKNIIYDLQCNKWGHFKGFIVFALKGKSKIVKVDLESFLYFCRLSFDNNGKIKKDIFYGIIKIGRIILSNEQNSKKLSEFIETVVDESGKRYNENVYMIYLYSVISRDDSKKFNEVVNNNIVNVQFLQNNMNTLLRFMVYKEAVKCIEYMKEELKIKLVFDEWMWAVYLSDKNIDSIKLIEFLKFLKKINIPGNAIKVNFLFRESILSHMHDCAEYIIENYDIKLDLVGKKLFINNKYFLEKYYNKFSPSLFILDAYEMCIEPKFRNPFNFSNIVSLIKNKDLSKKRIKNILFSMLMYGEKDFFYEIKNKYPKYSVNFKKVSDFINNRIHHNCIHPGLIILAIEQFGEDKVLETIMHKNIKILFCDEENTAYVLRKMTDLQDHLIIPRSFFHNRKKSTKFMKNILNELDIFNKDYFGEFFEYIMEYLFENNELFILIAKLLNNNQKIFEKAISTVYDKIFYFYNKNIFMNGRISTKYFMLKIHTMINKSTYNRIASILQCDGNYHDMMFQNFLGDISKFQGEIDEDAHAFFVNKFGDLFDEGMIIIKKE